MAADDVILRMHTLSRRSTWDDVIAPFNLGKIRAGDLPSNPQGQLELTFEFLQKENRNLARLLDERNQARHDELMAKLESLRGPAIEG